MAVLEFITNRYVLTFICALFTFGEMAVLKKTKLWFGRYTVKIKNVEAKTGVNLFLGIVYCFILSAGQMWAFCDVLPGAVFAWKWVIVATLLATGAYLMIEKIFGNAVTNKLGDMLGNYISHSDMFDGKISKKGMIAVAEKLFERVNKIDKAEAEKESKAIEEVVKRLDGFLSDGEVTAEERTVATELINTHNIDVNNSTYEKYRALLNR